MAREESGQGNKELSKRRTLFFCSKLVKIEEPEKNKEAFSLVKDGTQQPQHNSL